MKTYKAGLKPKDFMASMDEYYGNQDLYGYSSREFYKQDGFEDILRALQTPVNRSVEFYVAKVAVGSPTIITDNVPVVEAINQFNKWSNADALRRVVKRQLALYGDAFQRVALEGGKIFKEHLDSRYVTDFEEDGRNNLLEIRIDIPIVNEVGEARLYTEYWNKRDGYMAVYVHAQSDDTPLNELEGNLVDYLTLGQLGIDFIPIRHTKFRDVGEKWGANCVQHAIHKIDEANRTASYLDETYFGYGKPTTAVFRTETLPDGTPLPPANLNDTSLGGDDRTQYTVNTNNQIKYDTNGNPKQLRTLRQILNSLRTVYLPGMTDMKNLNTGVDFASGLAIVQSRMAELEKDLPEERYYSLPVRDVSGVALRQYLGAAIDRAKEAEDNLIADEVRLNEIGLTMGLRAGIFSGIGTFEGGAFDHNLQFEPVFDETGSEKADVFDKLADRLGVPLALKLAGYSKEIIEEYNKQTLGA